MTHQILKSQLKLFTFTPEQQKRGIVDFQSAVAEYAAELLRWNEREAKIAVQAPLPPKPQFGPAFKTAADYHIALRDWQAKSLEQIHPVPKPVAHPDIVAAVNPDGNLDFNVVNDDPTEDQVLRGKKDNLLHGVVLAEQAAKNAVVLPIGKRRLANLVENDIVKADYVRGNKFAEDATAAAKANGTPPPTSDDIANHIHSTRAPRDSDHLTAQQARRDKIDAITRKSAQVMSDIEDLTAANIDAFVIPSLT